MNTVLLPENTHRTFLTYIEKNHKEFAYKQIKSYTVACGEEKGTLVPYICDFKIQYECELFYVSMRREHDTPIFNGMTLGFLMYISVSHMSIDKLSAFIQLATNNEAITNGTIKIYHSKSRGYWEKSSNICGQTLDNIFIPQEIKTMLINHIDSFIANKERYLQFGRIYKLCFLLTGIPGAGKSSLIKAIAMKYNRPIYAVTLSKKLEDEALNDLIGEVKENSIIVLEDIDAFFVDRQAQDINISFSAILNLFDGLFSPGNGSILFMTGNNPERLDNALIRPGRVDKIIKFDYPKKREINDAFKAIVGGSEDEFKNFYKNIAGSQISMAGIIDYLFRHPEDYLDCISELNIHTQLLHEITDKNSQHLYK